MSGHPATSHDAIALHRELAGKVSIQPKVKLTEHALELVYTPGVSAVSEEIAEDPESARRLTWKGNAVAIVSDGSTVPGRGPEGPLAVLPVLEGKALLFKALAGIDAVPLPLAVPGGDELVTAVRALAPGFGAICLEDITGPAGFEVERRLREELDIPVLHDDRHGTAVVVLAALINAARVTDRTLTDARVVVVGAGTAGAGVARLLRAYGVTRLALSDGHGRLGPGHGDLDRPWRALVQELSLADDAGDLGEVLSGADAVVGLSSPGAFSAEDVAGMATDPIVFALADPEPELDVDAAREAGARVVATRRSDFPNQINHLLALPGLLRGVLDAGARSLDDAALCRAAEALAAGVDIPDEEEILPHVLDPQIAAAVAQALRRG